MLSVEHFKNKVCGPPPLLYRMVTSPVFLWHSRSSRLSPLKSATRKLSAPSGVRAQKEVLPLDGYLEFFSSLLLKVTPERKKHEIDRH